MDSHVHNLSGFLPVIHVAGMPVPVYFIFTSLSFIVGLLVLVKRGEQQGFSRNRMLDVSLVIMITGFVGSRLFHVFVEEPAYYMTNPLLVFDIWRGGFVWYGGALVAGACGVLFLRWKRESIAPWLDLFAPIGALGYAIGRFACFATGCCFGKTVSLPEALGGWTIRYPTQAFAVLFEATLFIVLLKIENARRLRKVPSWLNEKGQLFFFWLTGHAIGRLIMESFRGDPRGPEPLGLSVATWISLALLLSAGWCLTRPLRSAPHARA
jgi:phosphatidylglycerol---prolipoprotein diacylglyceryl transferase